MHILDFNPRRRQEHGLSTTVHGLTQRAYSTESRTPLGLFEGDEIYTGMPMWCTTHPLSLSYSAFFIDDERIVGVKVRPITYGKYPVHPLILVKCQEGPSAELSDDDSDCEEADILVF